MKSMSKIKTLIPISIIFVLIVSFGIVLATEYTVEEGGECSQDSDCATQVCKIVSCVDSQCVHTDEPDGTSCDDGLICTENDSCQSGSCSGQAVDIDDSIDCTIDSCDEINGVVHTPDNSLCNDGEICDSSNGCISSGEDGDGDGGGGGGGGDFTPPTIRDIEVSETFNSAAITWKTNESSLSWVEHGQTTDYDSVLKTTTYSIYHLVNITGLLSETIYHYKIKTKDQRGNAGSYEDRTFTTLSFDDPDLIERLKARIAEILAEISRLQALISQLQGGTVISEIPSDFKFEKNLWLGKNSEDVRYLQIFLNSNPDTRLKTQSGKWGFSGKESIHFGYLTKNAVIVFQEKYYQDILAPWKFARGTGIVGPTTRAKINELLGM